MSVFLFFFLFFSSRWQTLKFRVRAPKKKKTFLAQCRQKRKFVFVFFDLNRFISEAEVGNVASGDLLLLLLVLWQVILAHIAIFCLVFFFYH